MGFPEAWRHVKSRYARILMRKGGFTETDQVLVKEALERVGFESYIEDQVLHVPEMDLQLPGWERYWRIETRRIGPIDREIDEVFHAIIQRHAHSKARPAKARCSDCYACCNPPEAWITRPQRSRSCRLSQRLHPSKHREPPVAIRDPVYSFSAPRGAEP